MTFEALLVALSLGLSWTRVADGVWQREVRMAERGPLSAVRVVVVRIDPSRVRFALDTATSDHGMRAAWSSDRFPPGATFAANTGQFIGGVVWGWVVLDGVELSAPGTGSLAMSFVVDSAGTAALLTADELPRGGVRLAFQSYPALLVGEGTQPWEFEAEGRGVDLRHRDSRLAIGTLADGSMLVALTRFSALGKRGETMPWGPTVVEMAAFMRSLGCTRAMMLDGGISSQMSLRYASGKVRHWTNWRKVPMGLVVSPRG